jgi:hypothetical protein
MGVDANSRIKCVPTYGYDALPGDPIRDRGPVSASLPGEDALLLSLYGLLRSGQIVLRRV